MKQRLAVAVIGVACVLVGWAADALLTNEDIIRMARVGFGEAVIVAKIETSATDFDTSLDALVALKEAGVGDGVIAIMVKTGGASASAAQPTTEPAARPAAGSEASSIARAAPGYESSTPMPKPIPVGKFRDTLSGGGEGPEMVVIPAGRFRMGCLSNDDSCGSDEKPIHEVRISQAFALSVYEVTFEDYDRFTHPNKVYDEGWGRGNRPVINVSWNDAKEYVAWLSSQTGSEYRLPSESEWEYAARAGSTMKYSWGNTIGANRANCNDWGDGGCGSQWDGKQTAPVGSFAPNGFGLYDMHGNVYEWVEDCWNTSYAGAPSDGSPWRQGECAKRVLRGGSGGGSSLGSSVPRSATGSPPATDSTTTVSGWPGRSPLESLLLYLLWGGSKGGWPPLVGIITYFEDEQRQRAGFGVKRGGSRRS